MVVGIPEAPSDEWRKTLANFANMSELSLREALAGPRKGGARRGPRRAGMAATQP